MRKRLPVTGEQVLRQLLTQHPTEVRQPVIGRDVPDYFEPSNRLTRLVTGPGRAALLLGGLLCLVAGVLFNPRTTRMKKSSRIIEQKQPPSPKPRRTTPPRRGLHPA